MPLHRRTKLLFNLGPVAGQLGIQRGNHDYCSSLRGCSGSGNDVSCALARGGTGASHFSLVMPASDFQLADSMVYAEAFGGVSGCPLRLFLQSSDSFPNRELKYIRPSGG